MVIKVTNQSIWNKTIRYSQTLGLSHQRPPTILVLDVHKLKCINTHILVIKSGQSSKVFHPRLSTEIVIEPN